MDNNSKLMFRLNNMDKKNKTNFLGDGNFEGVEKKLEGLKKANIDEKGKNNNRLIQNFCKSILKSKIINEVLKAS